MVELFKVIGKLIDLLGPNGVERLIKAILSGDEQRAIREAKAAAARAAVRAG